VGKTPESKVLVQPQPQYPHTQQRTFTRKGLHNIFTCTTPIYGTATPSRQLHHGCSSPEFVLPQKGIVLALTLTRNGQSKLVLGRFQGEIGLLLLLLLLLLVEQLRTTIIMMVSHPGLRMLLVVLLRRRISDLLLRALSSRSFRHHNETDPLGGFFVSSLFVVLILCSLVEVVHLTVLQKRRGTKNRDRESR